LDKGRVAIGDLTDELVMLTTRPQPRSHMPSTTAWISAIGVARLQPAKKKCGNCRAGIDNSVLIDMT